MTLPPLHPDVAELAILVGTWRGRGRGDYPTIDPFEYEEAIDISHVGRPFLTYVQRTKRTGDHPEAGTGLHAETGYFRPAGEGRVELVLAQPSGIVEVHEGTIDRGVVRLASGTVVTTSTAKEVRTVERRIDVVDDTMTYELWMGAVGQRHQVHLVAELRREKTAAPG